jgi:uncharacterized protein (TIGR03067 family)
MRVAPLLAAFAAAGLVGSAAGQPPPDKAKKADGDLVRLQGEWAVTKVELPIGEAPAGLLKNLKVTVRGNRVTAEYVGELAGKREPEYALLILDSTKTPRHGDAIPADAKGQPRRRVVTGRPDKDGKAELTDAGPESPILAAYRLDGDALTVCVSFGGEGPRPTALKVAPPKNPPGGRDDNGYMLIHLTRKK